MADLEEKLRDLVRDWEQVFGDQNEPDLTRSSYRGAARQLTALLDQQLAEQAETSVVTEPSDPAEDQRVRLVEALAAAEEQVWVQPTTATQTMLGAVAWLLANTPTKGQLAAMVGAFADEIEKQEKPLPCVCPTCRHISIFGAAAINRGTESMLQTFARSHAPSPPIGPTWAEVQTAVKDMEWRGTGPTAKCTRCGHQLGTHSVNACHAPGQSPYSRCTCTGPTTAACVAHGDPGCAQCSLNPGNCLDIPGPVGCSTFAVDGVHWDTCPNRVTEILPNGDWRLTTDDVIEKANQP